MLEITSPNQNQIPEILEIAKKLSGEEGWFDDHALRFEIPNDLKFHRALIATIDNKIVGFLTYTSNEGEVFISWLGIDPDHHRQGIGTALLRYLENILKKLEIGQLNVETLSATTPYEPYVGTRAFYEKHGFIAGKIHQITTHDTAEQIDIVTYSKKLAN